MCDFCEKGKEIVSYKKIGDELRITIKKLYGNQIFILTQTHIGVDFSFRIETGEKICFCPYCGKELVKED